MIFARLNEPFLVSKFPLTVAPQYKRRTPRVVPVSISSAEAEVDALAKDPSLWRHVNDFTFKRDDVEFPATVADLWDRIQVPLHGVLAEHD
jgi:hypothetical protein